MEITSRQFELGIRKDSYDLEILKAESCIKKSMQLVKPAFDFK
jgi:hypothetical protein